MARRHRTVVHVAAGPHGRLRAYRSVWSMYVRIVFDGAQPQWAALLAMEARNVRPRGNSDTLLGRLAGYQMAAHCQYQHRAIVR